MRILALETSARAVSAAITEGDRVLASGYQDTGLTHSRTLMPIVEHLCRNTGLTVQDMDAIAVAAGPGSFTGLRIGVSAAKGLAWALDKPCVAVSTLEAMAQPLSHLETTLICAMDARRQQVYSAVFAAGVQAAACNAAMGEAARRRIREHFLWDNSARTVLTMLQEEGVHRDGQ